MALTPIRTALCSRLRLSSLPSALDKDFWVLERWLLALPISLLSVLMRFVVAVTCSFVCASCDEVSLMEASTRWVSSRLRESWSPVSESHLDALSDAARMFWQAKVSHDTIAA